MERVNAHVMFRKCTLEPFTGDVIAFFVEDYRYGEVVCYQHIGQHGTTYIEIIRAVSYEDAMRIARERVNSGYKVIKAVIW